jgi:electron transfer flavoprotein beta subunit
VKIIVLVKQVPDTETKIKVKPGEKDIDREGVNMVVNPYDEFAIEEALRIKEKNAGSEVVIISMGGKKAEEAIRTGLAMGADRAIRMDGDAFNGADPFAAAKAISKAGAAEAGFDLVLCGKQAMDDDQAQTGALVAEMLGIPSVCIVTKLELADGKAKVTREIEGGVEVVEVALPAVITCQKGLNEPRYPSLPGIMKAKKKEIKLMDVAALGLSDAEVGVAGSKTELAELSMPAERQAGKVFADGDPLENAKKVVQLLRDEAKVI